MRKQIIFTGYKKAELLNVDIPEMKENSVKIDMEYTVISGGTERANIMAMPNAGGDSFPKTLGYCGVGKVTEIGDKVTKVSVGDRCLVYHGVHSDINVIPEDDVTKVEDEDMDSLDAAFVIIASMGLGGVRKAKIEIGESAMVMGLGLLGIFAVQFCRLNGAYPVIAADLTPERRELALKLGADYAFDPSDEDFVEKVKAATKGKGVNACIEVTGVSKAMEQALECAGYKGRIALLGCTRISDCPIDYYQQVHFPGIEIIGAHNRVRPKYESYPHCWTHQDDCKAILDLISAGRITVKPIISRVVLPKQAEEVYLELCDNKDFPLGTVFDWRNI